MSLQHRYYFFWTPYLIKLLHDALREIIDNPIAIDRFGPKEILTRIKTFDSTAVLGIDQIKRQLRKLRSYISKTKQKVECVIRNKKKSLLIFYLFFGQEDQEACQNLKNDEMVISTGQDKNEFETQTTQVSCLHPEESMQRRATEDENAKTFTTSDVILYYDLLDVLSSNTIIDRDVLKMYVTV